MIVKLIESPQNLYGKYFLANEAPEEVKPGAKVKVISVKPDNRKRIDFSASAEDDTPEEIPTEGEPVEDAPSDGEEPNDDAPVEDIGDEEPTDDVDFSADGEARDTPIEGEGTSTDGGEKDTTDFTTDGEAGNETDTGEDNVDFSSDGEAGEEPTPEDGTEDTGDDVDFSAGGDDDGGETGEETPAEDTANTDDANAEDKGPGIDYGATRKFNLYKEFMSLHNSVENFVSKLESKVKDDVKENQIIKISTDTLRDTKGLLYDYMILKYESSTYDQNLIFFQKMVVTIQLVFNLLGNLQKKLTN